MRTRTNQNEDVITLTSNTEGLSSSPDPYEEVLPPRHQPIRGLSDLNMVLGGQEESPRIRYDGDDDEELEPVEEDDNGDEVSRRVLYTPRTGGDLLENGYKFREFTVKPLNYGFIITAGCHQFAIETPEKLAFVLSEYVLNPSDKETKWWKEKKI